MGVFNLTLNTQQSPKKKKKKKSSNQGDRRGLYTLIAFNVDPSYPAVL